MMFANHNSKEPAHTSILVGNDFSLVLDGGVCNRAVRVPKRDTNGGSPSQRRAVCSGFLCTHLGGWRMFPGNIALWRRRSVCQQLSHSRFRSFSWSLQEISLAPFFLAPPRYRKADHQRRTYNCTGFRTTSISSLSAWLWQQHLSSRVSR